MFNVHIRFEKSVTPFEDSDQFFLIYSNTIQTDLVGFTLMDHLLQDHLKDHGWNQNIQLLLKRSILLEKEPSQQSF